MCAAYASDVLHTLARAGRKSKRKYEISEFRLRAAQRPEMKVDIKNADTHTSSHTHTPTDTIRRVMHIYEQYTSPLRAPDARLRPAGGREQVVEYACVVPSDGDREVNEATVN